MPFFLPWRRPKRGPRERASSRPAAGDLARAARILAVRSRREATGLLAGSYATAFRGSGVEFEESRPYVAGDDIRTLDWNAFARTGELFVKRFREERDERVLLALDVSASMSFGTTGRSKAETAAHAAALIAAAAGSTGDRVGLLTFSEAIRSEIRPSRGAAHTWRIIEATALAAREPRGGTNIEAAVEGLLAQARLRSVAFLFSDFRPGRGTDPTRRGETSPAGHSHLANLGRQHDLVTAILHDPREESLPRAGLLRVRDPETARTLLVNSNSARTRVRYRRAWVARAESLERSLRFVGSDVLWMRTDRDPLQTLMHFFSRRPARSRVVV
jgi:uncharacterized protein (DUF58 family)